MSFLTNLVLFSPLLLIAFLILFAFDRKDLPRQGANSSQENSTAHKPDHESDNEEQERRDSALPESQELHASPDNIGASASDHINQESDFEIIEPAEGEDDLGEPTAFNPGELGAQINGAVEAAGFGPVIPAPRASKARIVGKKKAASLARRDQRRAYHEFMRSQASERARRNAALEGELEERIAEEKRRRESVEKEIAARKEKERKEKHEKEKLEEQKRKADLIKLNKIVLGNSRERKGRAWQISKLAKMVQRSEKWVVESLKMEGLVGVRDCGGDNESKTFEIRIVTGDNFYVVLTKREVDGLYASLDASGSKGMKWSEMAKTLQDLIVK